MLVCPREMVDRPSHDDCRDNQEENHNDFETAHVPVLSLELVLDVFAFAAGGSIIIIPVGDLVLEADTFPVATATILMAGTGGTAVVVEELGLRARRSITPSVGLGGDMAHAAPLGSGTGSDIRRWGRTWQARGALVTPVASAVCVDVDANVQGKIIRPAVATLLVVARHG